MKGKQMIKKAKDSIFRNMDKLFKDLKFKITLELFCKRKKYELLSRKLSNSFNMLKRIIILVISLVLARWQTLKTFK